MGHRGDDATTTNVVFSETDFTSVVVTNATTLTMTLNSAGVTKLRLLMVAGAKAMVHQFKCRYNRCRCWVYR